ncbi:MAG TPA: hypothetical protein IAB23_11745 [Candidatus Scybalocola faecavium]|nr:hypothetical protein [Candidatus Scybalocola faecavium]
MGEICIRYSELEDSIKDSKKARNKMDDYIDEIRRRITSPISDLPGSDSYGYASRASSQANDKIRDLQDKKDRFSAYETLMDRFVDHAKDADSKVSREIESLADVYIGKRTWYEKVGDWLYDTFCVDLANSNDAFRFFSDAVKWCTGQAGDWIESVRDYFKYGDGQYIYNMVMAGVEILGAIAGVVVAVVTFPATGPIAIAIAAVGLLATTVAATITIGNSVSKTISNYKAETLRKQGDNSGARYYGSIETASDYWEKHDMGDAQTNARYEKAGEIVDTVKIAADTVSFVTDIASLGNVKDLRFKDTHINLNYNKGKPYAGYSFTWKNIKRNLKHDFGFFQDGRINPDKAFDFKRILFSDSDEPAKKISENIKNITDLTDFSSDLFMLDGTSDFDDYFDTATKGGKVIGKTPILSGFDYVSDIGSNVKDWWDWRNEVMGQ